MLPLRGATPSNGKYLKDFVLGLQARDILAQWQRPERTTPWAKMSNQMCALKGQYRNGIIIN
jgi:hypothetical protein